MEKKVYKGFIETRSYGEADDVLFLKESDIPLAEHIMDDIACYGNKLSVSYFISDKEKSEEGLLESIAMQLLGDATADYTDRYSEITGYLWTDEELNVGGHDLLGELKGNEGKYLFLEIVFNK